MIFFCVSRSYSQHPFSTKWEVLKTDRLKIIYPQGLKYDALRLYDGISKVYEGDTLSMRVKPRRVPLVLSPTSVTSNGYASLFPYRMFFYSKPFSDCSLSSIEWFETLLTHEYRHIVQYSVINHGFTKFASFLFGAYGRSTLSYSIPQWFYEGDAVFSETVLTSQGRGRTADFDSQIASIVCGFDKDFRFDKMVLRSYRDFLPTHYPLGYMLVTKARRDFGEDVFQKAIRRSSWYSFVPYAFSIGFKKYSKISLGKNYKNAFSELRTFYKNRLDSVNAVEYEHFNKEKKRFYTNYDSPMFLTDTSMLCIKSSMSKPSEFVIVYKSGKEKKLFEVHSTEFDTDGKILIYASQTPDLRWSLRDYSDIVVYDFKTGKKQYVTRKQKYFSPKLSSDGKRFAVVEFSENRDCRIVIFKLESLFLGKYSAKILQTIDLQKNEYIRNLYFLDNNSLVYVSNYDNKNTIKILNLNDLTSKIVVGPMKENINGICVEGSDIFYSSDFSGIDNIFKVSISSGKILQVTNSKFGATNPEIFDKKLVFNDNSFLGKNVVVLDNLDGFERFNARPLNYFSKVLEKTPRPNVDFIATLKPDTTKIKSKRYSQLSDPIRIYGWIPNAGSGYVQGTIFSQNNLETLFLSATETYNYDDDVFRTDVNAQYSGFYPILQFSASVGENADYYTVKLARQLANIKLKWKENFYSFLVRLPLNLSRFHYSQNVSCYGGMLFYNVSNKPFFYFDDMKQGNFPVYNFGAGYSFSTPGAYRDFQKPFYVSFNFDYRKSLKTSLEAQMLYLSAMVSVRGIWRQNYLTMQGDVVQQSKSFDVNKLYLFNNECFGVRGYSSFRFQNFYKFSAEYSFPLGYPDIGIPSVVWVKRFRGGIFMDLAKGEVLDTNLDFVSCGFKVLSDFHLIRLPNVISAGISVSRGLNDNGYNKTQTSLILTYQL